MGFQKQLFWIFTLQGSASLLPSEEWPLTCHPSPPEPPWLPPPDSSPSPGQQLLLCTAELVHHWAGQAHSAWLAGAAQATIPCPRHLQQSFGIVLVLSTSPLNCSRKIVRQLLQGQISEGGSLIRGRDKIILSLPLIVLQTREKLQKWAFKSVCLFRMRKKPQTAVHSFLFKEWLKLSASQVH